MGEQFPVLWFDLVKLVGIIRIVLYMESPISLPPIAEIKPYTVLNFAKCNKNHIAFAISAFVIMTITILLLKMLATAHVYSSLGIAIPAYFFFGDVRTMNKHVSSREPFTTEIEPNIFPSVTPTSTSLTSAPVISNSLMKYIELIYDQFIVPVVYKYGAI